MVSVLFYKVPNFDTPVPFEFYIYARKIKWSEK